MAAKLPLSEEEERVEMGKFFAQLDLEKRTGKHMLFVETPYQLESVTAFSQYIFKDIRLITLIGERHNKSFPCEDPSISIAEYCRKAVVRNPRCRVMLEYNKGDDATRIGSEAVRSTFAVLTRAGKAGQIIPFDVRAFFLTPKGQNDLYSSDYGRYQPDEIGPVFIEPFYQKQIEDKNLFDLRGSYDQIIIEYIMRVYYPDMRRSFEEATRLLEANQKQHQVLKDSWKKVVDYYILAEILRNDDIDEYIIVAGDAHRANIQYVLNYFTIQLNNQTGRKGDCVKLFETYRI
jgi:hypothetical protein